MSVIPLLYSLLYEEYTNFKTTHFTMSNDQSIFKQKPLLLSQHMMNGDFINDIWITSNLDHPSNNTDWKLSSSHSFTSDIFQLAHIFTQCFSTCSGAWEFYHVECFHAQGHSTTDTVFSDTVRVTAVVKPPFCPLSLFQNYLLHWSSHF